MRLIVVTEGKADQDKTSRYDEREYPYGPASLYATRPGFCPECRTENLPDHIISPVSVSWI
jgi:hypothetical protein